MGPTHGSPSPENVGPLSKLSPGHPIWTLVETTAITLMNEETRQYWKADYSESCTISLEEGSRSSTPAMGQLVGFLSYAETLFSVQKRLADHAFSNARTWPEIQQAHQTWWHNYNVEHHFAHRERQDGRHSPEAVLRGVLGRTIPEDVLSRALYATQFTRQIDRHGYVRFKHWKFFGENGLAGEEVSVWIYEDTLKVEHQATTLSLYSIRLAPDRASIASVSNARRLETHFRSPQLDLWRLSDTEWVLALRRPESGPRKKASKVVPLARQLPLPIFGATG